MKLQIKNIWVLNNRSYFSWEIIGLVVIILFNLYSCNPEEEYRHTIHSEQSSPDGTKVVAWDDGYEMGKTFIFDNAYELNFVSENPQEKLDSIVATADGYKKFKRENFSVKDVADLDINLTQEQKTFWMYGEASTPSANAKFFDDGNVIEDLELGADGTYRTKDLDVPADNEIDSVEVSKQGFDRFVYKHIPVQIDGNKLELSLNPEMHDHWFSNTESTPGAHADWYKNGEVVMSADVDAQGDYVSNKWTTTNTSEVADSAIVKAAGFDDLKLYDVQVMKDENDLQLDLAAVIHQYKFVGSNTAPDGTTVEAWEDGENIASGTVSGTNYATGNWQSTLSNMEIDSVLFTNAGYEKKKFTNVNVVPGENELNAQLVQITFPYRFVSNNSSPDGTEMQAWENGSEIASAVVNNGSYVSNEWTSTLASMNIDSVKFSKDGYVTMKFVNVPVNTGNTTQDANLEEIPPEEHNYRFVSSNSSPNGAAVEAWENGQNIASGVVSNGSYITNDWVSTLTSMNIDSVLVTAAGFDKMKFSNVDVVPENNVLDANLDETTQAYWLEHNSSSPNGASITGWKDGVALFNGAVSGNAYETNHINRVGGTVQLDSIVANATGFVKQKTENVDMNPNGTSFGFDLDEEQQSNTYNEDVVFANQTADVLDNGLSFVIKTLSDGVEHTFPVSSAQHVQDIELNGPYESNEAIEAYFTATSATAQGKEDKVMTIIRSYEQPLASNGSRQTNLSTTIGDFFNGIADSTWVLSLDDNNDEAFYAHTSGAEWNYAENGKRTMNVNGITRELDIGTGTYGANITAEELEAIQDRVDLIDNEFMQRATGLKIMDVNYSENASYNASAGQVNIFFDRTDIQPGNTHYQISTTRPGTYDHATANAMNMTQSGQLTEEVVQAESHTGDYLGSMSTVIGHDGNGKPYLVRDDDFVVNFTYRGGIAPQDD